MNFELKNLIKIIFLFFIKVKKQMVDDENRAGFLKYFHIPSKWKNDENISFLISHRYIMEIVSKESIKNSMKLAGYLNNDKMLYDYLYYMIQDILDKNGEIYITKDTIKYNIKIKNLLTNAITGFLIKGKYPRKTFILDICFIDGYDQFTQIHEQYKKLSYFSNFCIINYCNELLNFSGCKFLSNEDSIYLIQNFEIFNMTYKYLKSCAYNNAIYWSDISSIKIKEFQNISSESDNIIFEQSLVEYAKAVASRDNI